MNEEKIINGYYQSNIKTSRNEDSVYAMKYASQQMLIEKLQQENARLKDKIENATKLIEEIKLHYQQSPTMIPSVKINKLEDLLKDN